MAFVTIFKTASGILSLKLDRRTLRMINLGQIFIRGVSLPSCMGHASFTNYVFRNRMSSEYLESSTVSSLAVAYLEDEVLAHSSDFDADILLKAASPCLWIPARLDGEFLCRL